MMVEQDEFRINGHEVVDGEVKPTGNGAHVLVPRDWIGADVKVVRTTRAEQNKHQLDIDMIEFDDSPGAELDFSCECGSDVEIEDEFFVCTESGDVLGIAGPVHQ